MTNESGVPANRIRIFEHNGILLNVDNEKDAERLLKDPLTKREIPVDQFGEDANLVSSSSTTLHADGSITFNPPDAKQKAIEGIQGEINKLEMSISTRHTRSAILGDEYAIAKLKDTEDAIDALRKELKAWKEHS